MPVDKSAILHLYKQLYKYSKQLRYTDKDFYLRYVRKQFTSVEPSQSARIELLFNKGHSFLNKQRLI
jgi:hypothetical protein